MIEEEKKQAGESPVIFCSLSDKSPAECKHKVFGNLILKDNLCSGNVLFVYRCPYRFDYEDVPPKTRTK